MLKKLLDWLYDSFRSQSVLKKLEGVLAIIGILLLAIFASGIASSIIIDVIAYGIRAGETIAGAVAIIVIVAIVALAVIAIVEFKRHPAAWARVKASSASLRRKAGHGARKRWRARRIASIRKKCNRQRKARLAATMRRAQRSARAQSSSNSRVQPAANSTQPKPTIPKVAPKKTRSLFWAMAWGIALAVVVSWVGLYLLERDQQYPGFVNERYEDQPADASLIKTSKVQLTLAARGYHGPTKLPENWDHFKITHSDNPGDWASVWCDGDPNPHKVHPAKEDFGPDEFAGCGGKMNGTTTFYAQGHGTILFEARNYK